jgi:hypothetical protein
MLARLLGSKPNNILSSSLALSEEDEESSSKDMLNTPSLGERKCCPWRRDEGEGVVIILGKLNPDADVRGAVRGPSSNDNSVCCHVPVPRVGVVGGVKPSTSVSSQIGKPPAAGEEAVGAERDIVECVCACPFLLLLRGTGTAFDGAGVGDPLAVAGWRRRASFPEGFAANFGVGRPIAGLLLLLRLLPLAVLSESESEETTNGSNKFDLALRPWLAKEGPSACEVCERVCTGEGWRVLLRRPCEEGLGIDGESLLNEANIIQICDNGSNRIMTTFWSSYLWEALSLVDDPVRSYQVMAQAWVAALSCYQM